MLCSGAWAREGDNNAPKEKFNQGLELAKQDQYKAAVSALETSLKLYPTRTAPLNLANAHKMDKRYAAAINAFEKLEADYGPTRATT